MASSDRRDTNEASHVDNDNWGEKLKASARELLVARAAHEAGHAAAALCLDLRPLSATAAEDAEGRVPRVKLPDLPGNNPDRELVWRWLIFCHAGTHAELAYTIREPLILDCDRRWRARKGAEYDQHDAKRLSEVLRTQIGEATPWPTERDIFCRSRREAKALVIGRKSLVIALRDALRTTAELHAAKLKEIFSTHGTLWQTECSQLENTPS